MSACTVQRISFEAGREDKPATHIEESDNMADPIATEATASEAQQPPSTGDGKSELSRFVSGNRTAQDIWWLRKEFDILSKKLKLFGPHFEDELETLEIAIEMFGDKEPEKA